MLARIGPSCRFCYYYFMKFRLLPKTILSLVMIRNNDARGQIDICQDKARLKISIQLCDCQFPGWPVVRQFRQRYGENLWIRTKKP